MNLSLRVVAIPYLLLFAVLAASADENRPPVFSPHLTVIDNGNPMRLAWDADGVPIEGNHQVLLFVPGPVEPAEERIVSFEWIANPTESLRGDERSLEQVVPEAIFPTVMLEEIGLLGGSRLAVLTLRLGYRDWETTSVRCLRGEIEIQFDEQDPPGTSRVGTLLQPVLDAYVLNESRTQHQAGLPSFPEPLHRLSGQRAVRVVSNEGGMVQVPGGELLMSFGFTPDVSTLMGVQNAQAVAVVVFDEGGQWKATGPLRQTDSLWFYQSRPVSPYSPEASTWLVSASGALIDRIPDVELLVDPGGNAGPGEGVHRARIEEDNVFLYGNDTDEQQNDYWMWHTLVDQEPFVVSVPGMDQQDARLEAIDVTLRVEPPGIRLATDSVAVLLNDEPLTTEMVSEGDGVHRVSSLVSTSITASASHELTFLYSVRTGSRQRDSVSIDTVTATWRGAIEPQAGSWSLESAQTVSVPGDARLFVPAADGSMQVALPGSRVDMPAGGEGFFLVRDPDSVSADRVAGPDEGIAAFEGNTQADMLIVAAKEFVGEMEAYRDALQRSGIRARLVNAQVLYDRFGDGRMSPHAIREGIRYAFWQWEAPAISSVLLVGDASWDTWKRYDSPAQNLLPSYRGKPLFAVEKWFAEVDGPGDMIPDLMIGRWAVRTVEELQSVAERSLRFRTQPPDREAGNRVFVLTDHGFNRYTEELDPHWIPNSFQKIRRHIADYPLIDNIYLPSRLRGQLRAKTSLEATADTVDILNRGAMLWTFYGHGAPNVIGNERIFFGGGSRFTDVKKLENADRPFFVWSFSCETCSFDYPKDKWFVSIGEDLLTHPGSGCVALFGATGRGYPHDHIWLSRGMMDAAFRVGLPMLGQHIVAGDLVGLAQQVPFEPKDQFTLLGDPTLSLPRFVPLEGTVEQREDDIRYSWTIPDALQNADEATVWVQGSRDILWSDTVSVAPFVLGTWTYRGADGTQPESVGIQVMAPVDGAWTIGQGSVAWPPQPAPPVIEPTTGRLPELAFVAGTVTSSPEAPRDGETIFIDARIENRGSATAQSIDVRGYRVEGEQSLPLTRVVGSPMVTIDRLDPRQSVEVRLRWDPNANAGEHTLELVIDERNRIQERDEDNNRARVNVFVNQKSDLVVDATHFTLEPRSDGQGFRMDFEIRNRGESVAERIVVEMTAKVSNQAEPVSVRPEAMYTEVLPAGESRLMRSINLPPTLEWVEILVDPDELVDESTHENNRYRFDVGVN